MVPLDQDLIHLLGGSTRLGPDLPAVGGSTGLGPDPAAVGGSTGPDPLTEGGSTGPGPDLPAMGGSTGLGPDPAAVGGSTGPDPLTEGGSTGYSASGFVTFSSSYDLQFSKMLPLQGNNTLLGVCKCLMEHLTLTSLASPWQSHDNIQLLS